MANMPEAKIKVTENGPYEVTGSVPLRKEISVPDSEGIPVRWEKGEAYPVKKTYLLCRCGHSGRKPFCDGSHDIAGFDGTETADKRTHAEMTETYTGPGLILKDAEKLCAVSLFCHRAGDAWNLTERSADPECRKNAIQETFDCPSGRLVACDKDTGRPMEPVFEPSIGVIEDPHKKISGPLWVKGGIPVESADGTVREVRNRVTLCRCGRSSNKPFCDGTHVTSGFNDGDKSLGGGTGKPK